MSQAFRIVVAPRAISQIVDQSDYYRLNSGPELAGRWQTAVRDTARSLRTMPERGAPYRVQTGEDRNLRRIAVHGFPQHSIFYRVDIASSTVNVLHMLHAARDIEAYLSSYRL